MTLPTSKPPEPREQYSQVSDGWFFVTGVALGASLMAVAWAVINAI